MTRLRRYLYLIFILFMLILSWESSLTNAALGPSLIPEESIRLRILAHSDSARDQWIKRKIRDQIVQHMNEWVQEPTTLQEAREIVQARIAELEQLVGETLRKNGFHYAYQIELGVVHFPTKLYGNQLYPAGEYEALRVTLGEGKGENWWCVLFPPLCFVDVVSGEAITEEEWRDAQSGMTEPGEGKQVRFFLWELLKDIIHSLKHIFASS